MSLQELEAHAKNMRRTIRDLSRAYKHNPHSWVCAPRKRMRACMHMLCCRKLAVFSLDGLRAWRLSLLWLQARLAQTTLNIEDEQYGGPEPRPYLRRPRACHTARPTAAPSPAILPGRSISPHPHAHRLESNCGGQADQRGAQPEDRRNYQRRKVREDGRLCAGDILIILDL